MQNRGSKLTSSSSSAMRQQGLFSAELLPISPVKATDVSRLTTQMLEKIRAKITQYIDLKQYSAAEIILDTYPGIIAHMLDCPQLGKLTVAIKSAVSEKLITVGRVEQMSKAQIFGWFSSDYFEPNQYFEPTWLTECGSNNRTQNRFQALRLFNPDELTSIRDWLKLAVLVGFCANNAKIALDKGLLAIEDIAAMPTKAIYEMLAEYWGRDICKADKKIKLKLIMTFHPDLIWTIFRNIKHAASMLELNLMSIADMNGYDRVSLGALLSDQGLIVMKKQLLTHQKIKELIAIPGNLNLDELLTNEKTFKALQNGMPIDEYMNFLRKDLLPAMRWLVIKYQKPLRKNSLLNKNAEAVSIENSPAQHNEIHSEDNAESSSLRIAKRR